MKRENKETYFKGVQICEGIALGKVCLFNEFRHNRFEVNQVRIEDAQEEKQRVRNAIELVSQKLDGTIARVEQSIGMAEAKIFVAQKMIVQDESVHAEIFDFIDRDGSNAVQAVATVLDSYEQKLLEIDDEYMNARATDIGEIKRRLLDALVNISPGLVCRGQDHCIHGKDRIVVAKELTPEITVDLDVDKILGIVTEHGGKLSHAAILAKALGIPAVSGIERIYDLVDCGMELLLNGDAGEVFIEPTPETIESLSPVTTSRINRAQIIEPVQGVQIFANINTSRDVDEAVRMKAEGIGLYRTEFEFFSAGLLLSEDEQYQRYGRVVAAMNGKPVYFRLLDVGGDKSADFLGLPEEENPYLGLRGSRLLIKEQEWFKTQARALARASRSGAVYVLYPMIAYLEQFLTLRAMFDRAIEDLDAGLIYHGVMLEVPSACLQAGDLMKHADFASIGTNDLIQYLFAVDRNNEYVASDYSPDRIVFWELLRAIAKAAEREDRPLSVCGEIAGNPEYVKKLIELGIRSFSVSPRIIPILRENLLADN